MIPSDSYEIPTPTPTPTPNHAKIDYQFSVSSEIYEEESFNLKLGLGEDVDYHNQFNGLKVFYEITQGDEYFIHPPVNLHFQIMLTQQHHFSQKEHLQTKEQEQLSFR